MTRTEQRNRIYEFVARRLITVDKGLELLNALNQQHFYEGSILGEILYIDPRFFV